MADPREVEYPVFYGKADGTVWPVSDGAEWIQRYGTSDAREAQRLGVASIIAAYSALTDPFISQREAIEKLRRARQVAVEHMDRSEGER